MYCIDLILLEYQFEFEWCQSLVFLKKMIEYLKYSHNPQVMILNTQQQIFLQNEKYIHIILMAMILPLCLLVTL